MTKKHSKALIISCLSILLVGCGRIPTLSNGEEVVVKINDKSFSANEYYEKLKESDASASILVNLVDEFISDKEKDESMSKDASSYAESQVAYLKTQYETNGVDFKDALEKSGYDSEKAFALEIEKEYLKQLVAKKYIKKNVTDEEINTYYKNEIYGDITVKHILIQPEEKEVMTDEELSLAEQAAEDKAKDIIAKIKKEGIDSFDKYAKEFSADKATAANGGLYENFNKDSVVENFFIASNNLKDGEMTDKPVKTEYGFHIIYKVSSKEKPAKDDVKDEIISSIIDKKIEEDSSLIRKTWIEIRKEYKMEIIDSKLDSIYKKKID